MNRIMKQMFLLLFVTVLFFCGAVGCSEQELDIPEGCPPRTDDLPTQGLPVAGELEFETLAEGQRFLKTSAVTYQTKATGGFEETRSIQYHYDDAGVLTGQSLPEEDALFIIGEDLIPYRVYDSAQLLYEIFADDDAEKAVEINYFYCDGMLVRKVVDDYRTEDGSRERRVCDYQYDGFGNLIRETMMNETGDILRYITYTYTLIHLENNAA